MKKFIPFIALASAFALMAACERPVVPDVPEPAPQPGQNPSFVESVPDTVVFTNADFIYCGCEFADAVSDGWIIKLYTDMEADMLGNPIGPGTVTQLCLNSVCNIDQEADMAALEGVYREMSNSGDFSPGTFVSGYMARLDLPGQILEIADGTYYADLAEGSTQMNYDLIDEGALSIVPNPDGTYTIEGVLVGKKYTKRYFTWTGVPAPRDNVPEEIPNSTLERDLTDMSFAKGQLQDKGDCFYLMDQSYRCLQIYLGEESVDMNSYRPAGDGAVLRLEVLVPWDTDIYKDGIPDGAYAMTVRNPDTSIDRDRIVPGAAVPGLPDVFEDWKVSGTWYYELEGGVWTQTYARIDGGWITVVNNEDGSTTISYDLLDCQDDPKRIQGSTTLDELLVPGQQDQPQAPQLEENTYMLDGQPGRFGSVEVSNIGEYICIAATPDEGIGEFESIFGQDEYFYVAISPLLNGKEFDLMTERDLYTVMSTLEGAFLESVAPSMLEEIESGKCFFDYKDGKARVDITLTLKGGAELAACLSAEESGIVVNENIFAISGDEKPLRTAFFIREDGLVTLYLTPAGIDFFEDIPITTYYAYVILDDTQCNGRTLDVGDIVAAGYGDNFNEIYVDSREVSAKGTLNVLADPADPSHYTLTADLSFGGTTLMLRYDGNAIDAGAREEMKNEVVYEGQPLGIKAVYVDMMPSLENTCGVLILTERDDMVRMTLPVGFLDGNAHGFSQSPYMSIEYDGTTYSKAEGYSGTVTVSLDDATIKIEATNYDNLQITYEGTYEVES